MARKQRETRRSQPKKYCFIVEGCTEKNYINVLKKLYQNHKVSNPEYGKGGSAIQVLREGSKIIEKYGGEYLGYVIWFDKDTYSHSSDSNLKNRLESRENVEIYMNEPCIENWLLAHFQSVNIFQNKCELCEKELKKHIPNYEKNDCLLLEKHINQENIETAIKNYSAIGQIPEKYFKNQL